MRLGIVLSTQCNATCVHCSQSCGPYRQEKLSSADVFRIMDEAAAIDDDQPLSFDLTGGEPFLDFDSLVEIVSHGARLGAQVSCVTNAYWSRTDDIARARLSLLQRAGLTALSVSVSRFHQRFVPIQLVRRTLATANELGIRTELKGAVTNGDLAPDGCLAEWRESLDADSVSIFPVLPHLREGESLPDEEYFRQPGLPFHRCPGDVVTVDPGGSARSCCTLGNLGEFLVVGNIHRMPLRQIHETFKAAEKQRILRESGPIEFARGAIAAGLGDRLRKAYAGPCDLCLHIQSDPRLREVAERMASRPDLVGTTPH